MGVKSIKGLFQILQKYSNFSNRTILNLINNLGFNLSGNVNQFKELSDTLTQCSLKGASAGFTGFSFLSDTIDFFIKNRSDIITNLEYSAKECGSDIFSLIQNFGIFRKNNKPSLTDIGKALWDNSHNYLEYDYLYNIFTWYALEEISHTWYRYLEDHPKVVEYLLLLDILPE